MKSLKIISPVLKYWRFDENPFEDSILKDEYLKMFIDREDELHQLHNSISGRIAAVYGKSGVGKSSFLRKFESLIVKDQITPVYVALTGTTEKALYREILAEILRQHLAGTIGIKTALRLNAKKELERLEYSIKIARESEFSESAVVKSGLKEKSEKHALPHSEDSAMHLICQIIEYTRTPFIVIIDDLERVKHLIIDEGSYLRFITGFIKTVDEAFSSRSVFFIISLDEKFARILGEGRGDDYATFSFNEMIAIGNFEPQQLIEFIKTRLTFCNWKKNLAHFIAPEAFWTLYASSFGHPRASLYTLRRAMEYVEKNQKPRCIDSKTVRESIQTRGTFSNEKDRRIIAFLYQNGPSSSRDVNFQDYVSLKRKQLHNRLKYLSHLIGLREAEEKTGNTIRFTYSLPQVEFE